MLEESGTELGSSVEMSGGELKGAALREYGTEVVSSGDISGINRDGKFEGYIMVE